MLSRTQTGLLSRTHRETVCRFCNGLSGPESEWKIKDTRGRGFSTKSESGSRFRKRPSSTERYNSERERDTRGARAFEPTAEFIRKSNGSSPLPHRPPPLAHVSARVSALILASRLRFNNRSIINSITGRKRQRERERDLDSPRTREFYNHRPDQRGEATISPMSRLRLPDVS